MCGVGYSLVDRVEKSGVGVGRKIHHDARGRRHCASHFDIEHHLGIGAASAAGRLVLPAVYGYGHDSGSGRNSQPAEVRVEIGLSESSSKLNDPDRLSLAVHSRGKAVGLRYLQRGVGHCRGGVRLRVRTDSKVRLRLWTIIEAVHALHNLCQLAWYLHSADTPAIGAALMLIAIKFHFECLREVSRLAGQQNAARGLIDVGYCQSLRRSEFADFLDIRWISAIIRGELLAADPLAAGDKFVERWLFLPAGARTQNQRHLHLFVGIDSAGFGRPGQRFALASRYFDVLVERHRDFPRGFAKRRIADYLTFAQVSARRRARVLFLTGMRFYNGAGRARHVGILRKYPPPPIYAKSQKQKGWTTVACKIGQTKEL
jgi:hypothetical protein